MPSTSSELDITDIIAIHGRTAVGNGVSRPFRCEGEDGHNYFVKHKNAGYECLVKEWVTGRLAREMGLPVADIRQVRISPELIAGNQEYELELGHGLAFGSKRVVSSERLAMEFIRGTPNDNLSRILLFDWWTRNSDRALTDIGGNPNLLWEIEAERVVMIDHDNAFDSEFDPAAFWTYHALRDHQSAWMLSNREEMNDWLASGASQFENIWKELPNEWLVDDIHSESRCGLDKEGLMDVLLSHTRNNEFWKFPETSL